MQPFRIALANLRPPETADHSLDMAVDAIEGAGKLGAQLVCFPECFVPGYRWPGTKLSEPDPSFLSRAIAQVAEAARRASVGVILGTERITERGLQITACIFNTDGDILGWQDKVHLDPDEEDVYPVYGEARHIFQIGGATFGVVICHEGWRYPETVRWAARRGAQLVFHPSANAPTGADYRPKFFGDPANSFHEKSILCRAAENGCYFASASTSFQGKGATSAVAGPDGQLICYQPYDQEGILIADLDLELATCDLAKRYRPALYRD